MQDLEARLLQNQDDSGTIDETTTLQKVLPSRIERSSGYMQSVEHVLSDITDIQALEGTVSHYELGYTGTFDCVAKYRYIYIYYVQNLFSKLEIIIEI